MKRLTSAPALGSMLAFAPSIVYAAGEVTGDVSSSPAWWEGWQLVLLTALVTTVGTWFVTRYQLKLQAKVQADIREEERERHGSYVAIRVVCALDNFVNGCIDVVHDDGMNGNDGYTEPREAAPNLIFPNDVDWKSIDAEQMYRALSLPNEIASADQAIAWVADQVASPPDYDEFFTERILRYGQLGLSALKLADDLRVRYRMPARKIEGWGPREALQKKVNEAEKQKEKDGG
ncbi:hypothetical protein ACFWXH_04720 [Mesorhizobium sp. NPDC059054]|uniref:hypothetical protein n=1 Tax=Mesorhizobium sp. NPDC059054 TaxID=3346711 RepID=UPI0036AD3ADA